MTEQSRDAFGEGEEARWGGYSEDANPYDPDTEPDAYKHWRDGWHAANDDLDDSDEG